MTHQFYIFLQFFKRDIALYLPRLHNYLINYAFLYPLLNAISFCYLQSNVYFGVGNYILGTTVFAGQTLILFLVLAYGVNIMLLFDLESNRFIEYQIVILNPRLVLLQRMLFAALFTFAMLTPFFYVAKLFMGPYFVTTNTSWVYLHLIMLLAALCCSAYTQLATCIMRNSRQLRKFWLRVNFIFVTFGGLLIPWSAINAFSKVLGTVVLINPFLYITEGLRQSIIGGPQFFSIATCVTMLTLYTICFTGASWYFFKKKVDHI